MPRYRYTAVDVQGTRQSGDLDASNEQHAREQLAARGLSGIELSLESAADQRRTLSAAEAQEVSTYVAELASAGLPLAAGLRAFAEEMPRSRVAPRLVKLAQRLESGEPLERAIDSTELRLPEYYRGLIEVAVRSGNFGTVLQELLKHERLVEDMRSRMWRTFAYPLMLASLVAAWVVFVMATLVPQMGKIYEDFDTRLPGITIALLWLQRYGALIAAVVLVTLLVTGLAIRFMGGRAVLSNLLARMPLFGPLWRNWTLSEFCNLLRVLVEQSIPIPRALELTASGMRDAALSAASQQAAARVSAGNSLAESLAAQAIFPPTLVTLIEWGERSSSLKEALESATEMLETRAVTRDNLLRAVVGPTTFLVMASVMVAVLGAMYLPLFTLITSLS